MFPVTTYLAEGFNVKSENVQIIGQQHVAYSVSLYEISMDDMEVGYTLCCVIGLAYMLGQDV